MNHIKHNSQTLDPNNIYIKKSTGSEVRKIIQVIRSQKQQRHTENLRKQPIFALKNLRSDFEFKQSMKNQKQSKFSLPNKWKNLGNTNKEFNAFEVQSGKALTGWQMQRANMAQRSYQSPRQYHGIKFDNFSREFPKDLSKTCAKQFSKKLKQYQKEYQKKVFAGNLQILQQRKKRSIDAIRNRGTKFQLSKEKLFGFPKRIQKSNQKII